MVQAQQEITQEKAGEITRPKTKGNISDWFEFFKQTHKIMGLLSLFR